MVARTASPFGAFLADRNVADPGNMPIDFVSGIVHGDRKMRTEWSVMR
jgi:hypothetical protein